MLPIELFSRISSLGRTEAKWIGRVKELVAQLDLKKWPSRRRVLLQGLMNAKTGPGKTPRWRCRLPSVIAGDGPGGQVSSVKAIPAPGGAQEGQCKELLTGGAYVAVLQPARDTKSNGTPLQRTDLAGVGGGKPRVVAAQHG